MNLLIRAAGAALICFSGLAFAQATEDQEAQAKALLASLQYQTGAVAVTEAKAHLDLKPGFRFLPKQDARKVLEQYWGNPPDETVLGLIVPEKDPLGTEHSWAVVLTYSEEGYVSDEDANKIDYTDLLKDMKAATKESNEERKNAGYQEIELVGWAEPPRYDASSKRLYWAKELSFVGQQENALNYDIRVLGRQGYLSLEAVASITDLNRVNEGMKQILPMAQFDAGNTYADYNASTDKLAAYGLAALVGGGIAAKAGLFAKLGAILLAGKKFIVLLFLGIGAFFKKLFGKKDGNKTVE
ncbi:MAG: DUF2167 domain-containing protein [Arenimonas sp.]